MRLSRSFVLCVATTVLAFSETRAADPITWRTDYIAARKEAAKSKRPLLIVVTTADCPYCEKLLGGTFGDSTNAELVSSNFITVQLDAGRNPEFVKAMRVTMLPTTIVAGSDGAIHGYLVGFHEVAAYREQVSQALNRIPGRLVPVVPPPVPPLKEPAEVKMVASEPSAVERFEAAKVAYARGEYAEALERFETLVRLHPKAPESQEASAIVGKLKTEAERLAAAAAEFDERTAAAYYGLAEEWGKRGKLAEASECYAKVLRVAPNSKTAALAREKLTAIKQTR